MSRSVKRSRSTASMLLAGAMAAVLALAGCTSKAKKADQPATLVPLVNRIEIHTAWHTHLPGERPKLRLGLAVAVSGTRAFAASYDGRVIAYELATGRRLWERALRAPLAGGPGAGAGLVVLGSSKGEVIALSDQDGTPRWRVRVNSEVLSAPAIGRDIVLVRTVDGKLHALSSADGSESWSIDQQVPRLSLRGTGTPTLVGDLAVCGFDNGRVVAVVDSSGATAWEVTAAVPHGSGELQRLADVDAPVIADGDDLFAVGYQGRVVRIARESGQVIWGRDLSSYRGLAVDADAVYVSTADGDVVRLDRRTGVEEWRQHALVRRQLSAPALDQGRVVVADYAGVVHWLDPETGAFLARATVSGKGRISAAPLSAGALLLVFSDAGELEAFRSPAAPPAVPAGP